MMMLIKVLLPSPSFSVVEHRPGHVFAASATFHPSPRIMLAALKFFLGQDQAPEEEEDDSSDEEEDGDIKALGPTKAEFYKANKKVGNVHKLAGNSAIPVTNTMSH